MSRSIVANGVTANVKWHEFGSRLDHAAVCVKVKPALDTARGRGFPKLFKSDISKEGDRVWLLDQLRISESQIPAHWNPHLRLEFIKTMLRSKTLELRSMNKFVDNKATIQSEINLIMSNTPLSNENLTKLEALKLKLTEVEDREARENEDIAFTASAPYDRDEAAEEVTSGRFAAEAERDYPLQRTEEEEARRSMGYLDYVKWQITWSHDQASYFANDFCKKEI